MESDPELMRLATVARQELRQGGGPPNTELMNCIFEINKELMTRFFEMKLGKK